MGFLSGRATFSRFRIDGRSPKTFTTEHLDHLAENAIGSQRLAPGADGVETGWIAADHILDTQFDLAKNVINDALHFAIRIDQQKIPGDLVRAYAAVELQALAKENPSGFASPRQRKLARASAMEKLEREARDGRYLRRKAIPALWDGPAGELLIGSTSASVIAYFLTLFQKTFHRGFEALTAGRQAFQLAELRQLTRGVDDAQPTAFIPSLGKPEVAWLPDSTSRDFLGNEFLLWLWYVLDDESDTLKLADDSEAVVMVARNLVLECPRGQTGSDSISSEGPSRLPEAKRAIQSGKLPRKAGLTVVRHDRQYELTLHAETLAVGSAKLPVSEEEEERARLEERIEMLRHLRETIDLLYEGFCQRRASSAWPKELAKMQKWLQA